ncbi:MAG: type II toxin-antitoxin system VapC family toxin [Variibacter sp.]|nr:type II toxin-antitoxin system VapC family toxin [Variibacter sp.]
MRLLLDTHILLAYVAEDDAAFPAFMRHEYFWREALLFVSVASLWEIAIKANTGKLKLDVPLTSLPNLVERLGMTLLVIDQHHVLNVLDPVPPTRDPFDRLLLAQCAVEDMRLITLDRALVDHPLAYRPV